MKPRSVKIGIPSLSGALSEDLHATLSTRFSSVEFIFVEEEPDSKCHIIEAIGLSGPAALEEIRIFLKRVERKYQ